MIRKVLMFCFVNVICVIIVCLATLDVMNINKQAIIKLRDIQKIEISNIVDIENAKAAETEGEVSTCEVGSSCPCGATGSECTVTFNGQPFTIKGRKD
ncbi:hypothetical protein FA048_02005 [Pedobacter polaris]|uniref:NVEALA protein n=1 Tax=Pedobacter polaris TaxID=2571273 RepID=A0A4U1CW09_9SPHI|nr:hypothetical protein [Pedobacter polaris]TKC12415.1 hypothetical protein FA048_02005 [Pedobacter polaris]